jgi:flagella basal body P-ring formation protein FlgA
MFFLKEIMKSSPYKTSAKTPTGKLAVALTMALLVVLVTPARSASSQPAPLSGSARPIIDKFLLDQTTGLAGKVGITVDTPMSGALPACETIEPFLPVGSRPWGRISVGVRCTATPAWTRYVPAYISVTGSYYVAARQINAGQTLVNSDAAVKQGDLTALPAGVIVDPAQFSGLTAINGIALGAPLRRELLRSIAVVKQGQSIKMVTQGPGFQVSTEGKAMTNAAIGALVQVKMQAGQVLTGVVRPDGMVERQH